eukprot:940354-Karenia_brevis.AAC.1
MYKARLDQDWLTAMLEDMASHPVKGSTSAKLSFSQLHPTNAYKVVMMMTMMMMMVMMMMM